MKKLMVILLISITVVGCNSTTDIKTNWNWFRLTTPQGKEVQCVSNTSTTTSNWFSFSCDWSLDLNKVTFVPSK